MVNCINLIIEMNPRFPLGRENVPCVAEVVNRSLKADCTDFICYLKVIEGHVSLLTLPGTLRVCINSSFFGYFDCLERSAFQDL